MALDSYANLKTEIAFVDGAKRPDLANRHVY